MQRVRRDIYSGVVLERIIYSVGDRTQKPYRPRKPRFKTDEERARFDKSAEMITGKTIRKALRK